MTEDEKKAAFKSGRYTFPPPPGPTFNWNDEDWIKYIDMQGTWNPPQE